jgi:hypothetical protein
MAANVPLRVAHDPLIAEAHQRARRRWLLTALILLVVAGAAAGVALALRSPAASVSVGSGGAGLQTTKTLVGSIFFVGRVPADLPNQGREAGIVHIYKGSRRWSERVQRGDQFRFALPPGRYTAEAVIKYGTWAYGAGEGTHTTDSLVVRKGYVTTANIYCLWH